MDLLTQLADELKDDWETVARKIDDLDQGDVEYWKKEKSEPQERALSMLIVWKVSAYQLGMDI